MDVSDIFYFFSARVRGRGSPRRHEGGGGQFFIENPMGGVSRGGPRGRRVSAGNFLGGGG